jgi:hypothetical protein
MATSSEGTPVSRWQVFVSSTGLGLDGFRRVARDVIDGFRYEGIKCFEPVRMEDFGARDSQAREFCAAKVRGCDILVGIIGIRYGSHPPDDQPPYTSYTELEYRTAVEQRISRLMFVLEEKEARRLEEEEPLRLAGRVPQREGEAQRQKNLRDEIGQQRVCAMDLVSEEDFRHKLEEALTHWVEEDSFKPVLVGRETEFDLSRRRLLAMRAEGGGTALVFGEPGTGKTAVVTALLADPMLRRSFIHLAGPVTVQFAEGADAIGHARATVLARLQDFAGQSPDDGPATPESLYAALGDQPLLVALFLATDDADDAAVAQALGELPGLFDWRPLRVVVLAETNDHSVRDRMRQEFLPPEGVITIRDFDEIGDALELMRRNAPDVPHWPEPDTETLADSLGMRPVALRDVATYIDSAAQGSADQAAALVREQLTLIEQEKSPAGRRDVLIRSRIGHLSEAARDLLSLMTVLHPKPTLFPDAMALALDLSLSRDDAIRLVTAEDDDDDDDNDDDQEHRNRASALVAELVSHGLLERYPRIRPAGADSAPELGNPELRPPELLTLHSMKIPVIRECVPLSEERCTEGHARAEAFYHQRIGDALMGSFDSRFRMEDGTWWDDVEEWIYHLGHLKDAAAGLSYATLFLDAFWWWDLYVPFEFCGKLLAYGHRPLVRATSPDMPEVVSLLERFRRRYPRDHPAGQAQIFAEITHGGPGRGAPAGLADLAERGARVVKLLGRLCASLGLSELGALLTDAPAAELEARADAPVPGDDMQRHHLQGLICLLLAHGHRYRALAGPDGHALYTAEVCYRRARAFFQAQGDDWDLAWARYELGDVMSQQDHATGTLWDDATAGADAEGDTELLANIERARADSHLRSSTDTDLEQALVHYGRAVFYGVALQVTSNVEAGADRYTQAFYREIRLHAAKPLVEPLLRVLPKPAVSREDPGALLAEARRRLQVMLSQLDGAWKPDTGKLDRALESVAWDHLPATVGALADVAFPPGPDDAMLLAPQTQYHQWVRDLVSHVRPQPWVRGLHRWRDRPAERDCGKPDDGDTWRA